MISFIVWEMKRGKIGRRHCLWPLKEKWCCFQWIHRRASGRPSWIAMLCPDGVVNALAQSAVFIQYGLEWFATVLLFILINCGVFISWRHYTLLWCYVDDLGSVNQKFVKRGEKGSEQYSLKSLWNFLMKDSTQMKRQTCFLFVSMINLDSVMKHSR